MRSHSWLTVLKVVVLVAFVLVGADVAILARRAHNASLPLTTPKIATDGRSNAPVSMTETTAVDESRALLGQAPDITKVVPTIAASTAIKPGTTPSTAAADTIPEPSKTMTLIGTMASRGGTVAFVVVDGKQQILHERDTSGPFIVKEIRDASMILEMQGQTRTLWMPSFVRAPAAAASADRTGSPPSVAGLPHTQEHHYQEHQVRHH